MVSDPVCWCCRILTKRERLQGWPGRLIGSLAVYFSCLVWPGTAAWLMVALKAPVPGLQAMCAQHFLFFFFLASILCTMQLAICAHCL